MELSRSVESPFCKHSGIECERRAGTVAPRADK
jgi:hypothetical protein